MQPQKAEKRNVPPRFATMLPLPTFTANQTGFFRYDQREVAAIMIFFSYLYRPLPLFAWQHLFLPFFPRFFFLMHSRILLSSSSQPSPLLLLLKRVSLHSDFFFGDFHLHISLLYPSLLLSVRTWVKLSFHLPPTPTSMSLFHATYFLGHSNLRGAKQVVSKWVLLLLKNMETNAHI